MHHQRLTDEEIVRRGQDIYERTVRHSVEPLHTGKFLALDVESGEYEIDAESIAAIQRARAKHPDAALYVVRVGHRTAYRLGGRFLAGRP